VFSFLNPEVLQTPIVGVYRCLSGSTNFPHERRIWAYIFSYRRVRSTSRQLCRINADPATSLPCGVLYRGETF